MPPVLLAVTEMVAVFPSIGLSGSIRRSSSTKSGAVISLVILILLFVLFTSHPGSTSTVIVQFPLTSTVQFAITFVTRAHKFVLLSILAVQFVTLPPESLKLIIADEISLFISSPIFT